LNQTHSFLHAEMHELKSLSLLHTDIFDVHDCSCTI
jgi:hypothetical protein